MLENKDESVLDKTNNVLVGPHEYFRVVVDDFDGKTVNAWHFEDKEGNRTAGLSERAKGKDMDLVVSGQCRSTAHFFSRVHPRLYREALEKQSRALSH